MSYSSEHRRLKPVIDMARKLDVSKKDPRCLYEAGSGGFQIYCTPTDNPGGDWEKIKDKMSAGAFDKPAEYLASVTWRWMDETVVGVFISTEAYALKDHLPDQYSQSLIVDRMGLKSIRNRPEDVNWARKKVIDLFCMAGIPAPAIFIEE